MKLDQLVDKFVERMKVTGVSFQGLESAPWIAEFEAKLPRRLPRSFSSLVTRYCFLRFEFAELEFFANLDGQAEEELSVAAFKDKFLWQPALTQGFVQIGRPSSGSYDPICFDMRQKQPNREYPLVRLDHEELLQRERVRIVEKITESFLALITTEEWTG